MPKDTVNKQEDACQISANGTPALQRKGKSAIQPADNPTVRSYQEMADNSPRVKQLKAYQAIANHNVVQLRLADDLNSKKVNVAIAGEIHGEIPPHEEIAAWAREGITLHYEADSLPLNDKSGRMVEPDPLNLRLGFAFTVLSESIGPFIAPGFKPDKGAGVAGAKGVDGLLNYVLPILITDVDRLPGVRAAEIQPMLGVLRELRDLLRIKGLAKTVSDELAWTALASKLRRSLVSIGASISAIHGESEFKGVAFNNAALMVARSQQMLDRVNKASGAMDTTVYKVGNDHVVDMRRERWAPAPKVAVLNRAEYKSEYETLGDMGPARAAGPAPKSGALPASAPALPPMALPVPSAKPGSVPASSPAQPPMGLPLPSAKPAIVPGSVPVPLPAAAPAVPAAPKKKSRAKVVAAAPAPAPPAKSAEDLVVEQLLVIFNAVKDPDVIKAKGYGEIKTTLGFYIDKRTSSDRIINQVKRIIKERNDRNAAAKLFRSRATQQLYDNLTAVIGV